jgi:putative NADH-flavin reductase/catechol 2,3-dioxygenase-like lactoylglutathione lyase family enzyme
MRLAVLGVTGAIGSRIVSEAITRGHQITALVRAERLLETGAWESTVAIDPTDAVMLAHAIAGHDAVVSAIGMNTDSATTFLADVARALLAAVERAGVDHLLVVGGAGSLSWAETPEVDAVDDPAFPVGWRRASLAQREALRVLESADEKRWTYLSPANEISPGMRTGAYAVGLDQFVADSRGRSYISTEDYAVALIDEIETKRFIGRRFTVGTSPGREPTRERVEHVGITVPDVDVATRYFADVLGATVKVDLIERGPGNAPPNSDGQLSRMLGTASAASTRAIRVLCLGDGAEIELFEFENGGDGIPPLPSAPGGQHIAVRVENLDRVAARTLLAGGQVLSGPHARLGAAHYGSRFRYTRAPWGTFVELVT